MIRFRLTTASPLPVTISPLFPGRTKLEIAFSMPSAIPVNVRDASMPSDEATD
jgi:hypothetical protein